MWPEDNENDYSIMNLRKQYEQLAADKQNDSAKKLAKVGIATILKMIM